MSEERVKELLDFLASMGFEYSKLEHKVKQETSKGEQTFAIKHSVAFGKEMVFFDLYFNRDYQFNAYRLERYTATHRKEISVEHQVINGIDTKHLETRVAMEDWDKYLKGDFTGLNAHDQVYIGETVNMLNKLSEGQNFNGMAVQESLMFKYWPSELYDHPSKSEFQMLYENKREFTPSESGFCNANLAYYIVSGRLDELYSNLRQLGLETFPGKDVYSFLETKLSDNPAQFELRASTNTAEGYLEFKLPITRDGNDYCFDDYHLTFAPHPHIEQMIHNGIDTSKLEALMQEIDWRHNEPIYSFDENRNPELLYTSGMTEIMRQMNLLSTDKKGEEVVMQLQLKYYRSNDFLTEFLEDEVWEYLKLLPQIEYDLPAEVEVKAGYNLLCGRAVLEKLVFPFADDTERWVKLDLSKTDELINFKGISDIELYNLIDMLPIGQSDPVTIRQNLERGDLVHLNLKNGKKILLEANPQERTINIYTKNFQPIPVNIGFDPGWIPPKSERHISQQPSATERDKPKFKPNYQFIRNKRRGL